MKKYYFFMIICIISGITAIHSMAIDISDMRTPTSPAFTIMSISPENIAKPQTPKDLGISLVTTYNGNNIGIDFAPYWLMGHPNLTFDSYYKPTNKDAGSIVFDSIIQNLSISLCKINDASQSSTILGGGIRTILWPGHFNQTKLDEITKQIETEQQNVLINSTPNHPADDTKLKKLAQQFQKEIKRVGLVVETGAATTTQYNLNNWNNGNMLKRGLWGTISYTTEDASVDFIGIIRNIEDNVLKQSNNDLGLRIVYHLGEEWGLSAEYLSRTYNAINTNRYVAIIDYKINDNMYLTGSIGKDFDNSAINPVNTQNIVAAFGLNWGFGETPTVTK